MRLRWLPSHSFRPSRFTLARRITSLLPTTGTLNAGLIGRIPDPGILAFALTHE
jgi:hypothetical protein